MNLIYSPQSANDKTGNIPQQYIGANDTESKATCIGCPLLRNTKRLPMHPHKRVRLFGLACYAHRGHVALAHKRIAKRPWRMRTLTYALGARHCDARYFRLGARGDISAIPKTTFKRHYKRIRAAKLGVLAYTHFYRRAPWLRRYALASVDTLTQARDALARGWRVALHVPDAQAPELKVKLRGINWRQCLHETGVTTCNTCGLCDVEHKTRVELILFTQK